MPSTAHFLLQINIPFISERIHSEEWLLLWESLLMMLINGQWPFHFMHSIYQCLVPVFIIYITPLGIVLSSNSTLVLLYILVHHFYRPSSMMYFIIGLSTQLKPEFGGIDCTHTILNFRGSFG